LGLEPLPTLVWVPQTPTSALVVTDISLAPRVPAGTAGHRKALHCFRRSQRFPLCSCDPRRVGLVTSRNTCDTPKVRALSRGTEPVPGVVTPGPILEAAQAI